jgi:hypothetical protein
MNVASLFGLFGGMYMAGAFWFSPILKIGPIPTPGTPESTLGPAPGIERHPLPRASTFRTLLGYQLPPPTVATHHAIRENGTISPAAEAIYGASAYQFSQAPEDERQ